MLHLTCHGSGLLPGELYLVLSYLYVTQQAVSVCWLIHWLAKQNRLSLHSFSLIGSTNLSCLPIQTEFPQNILAFIRLEMLPLLTIRATMANRFKKHGEKIKHQICKELDLTSLIYTQNYSSPLLQIILSKALFQTQPKLLGVRQIYNNLLTITLYKHIIS